MNKFKVGDKVRVINDQQSDLTNGDILVVKYVQGNYVGFDVDYEPSWLYERFELAEPQYTWTSKFNIGDMVVDEYDIVQTIEEILFSDNETRYYTEYGGYNESELSLYTEPQVKEVTMEELEDILGYKVKIVKEVTK